MCLDVTKSTVRKPIYEMECFKILKYLGNGQWATPYQDSPVVKGTGWFMPVAPAKRKVREYRKYEEIEGGYIHAWVDPICRVYFSDVQSNTLDKLPSRPQRSACYRFRCIAREVVAVGDHEDIVCRALYIPAFDVTGQHRNAILDM